MLAWTAVMLLVISISTGMYAFAEGTGKRKSVSWAACMISSLLLAAILLATYLRFVLMELPSMG